MEIYILGWLRPTLIAVRCLALHLLGPQIDLLQPSHSSPSGDARATILPTFVSRKGASTLAKRCGGGACYFPRVAVTTFVLVFKIFVLKQTRNWKYFPSGY